MAFTKGSPEILVPYNTRTTVLCEKDQKVYKCTWFDKGGKAKFSAVKEYKEIRKDTPYAST